MKFSKDEALAQRHFSGWPGQQNKNGDSICVMRPVDDPMPEDLKEFLLNPDWYQEYAHDYFLEHYMADGDGLNVVYDIYCLLDGLEHLRYGVPDIVVPPLCAGTSYEMPGRTHPGHPAHPELVKEEWLEWLAARVPGFLYISAYTGCV